MILSVNSELISLWQCRSKTICCFVLTHTHTHTQPFYCSSGICPGLPGWV